MCDCCQCTAMPIAFEEISNSIKPCISLSNESDASHLYSVLHAAKLIEGLCIINGCEASVICGSIDDMLKWRRDNTTAPTSDLANIVNLLIPSLDGFVSPLQKHGSYLFFLGIIFPNSAEEFFAKLESLAFSICLITADFSCCNALSV